MKLTHLLVITAALFAVSATASAQPSTAAGDSLSLNDVVQRALQNNPMIKKSLEDVRAAQARVEQSRSGQYPVVYGQGDYTRLDPIASLGFGNQTFDEYPHDNFDVHLGGSYEVYDFGKKAAAVDLSRSRVEGATHQIEVVKSGLAYRAIQAFNSLLFLEQSVIVKDQEIAALNEHLDVARKKVAAGVATDYDVLTTQVRVATAENQKVDLRSAEEKQKAALRELMGLSGGEAVSVKGELELVPVGLNRDSLITLAYQQRTEIKLAHDAQATAEKQYRVAELGDLPSLSVHVTAGWKNGYPEDLNAWKANWVGGAGVEVPIFDGWRKRYQKGEAQATLLSERSRAQSLERSIEAETERAITDVKAALEKLTITEVQIRQATDAVKLARARYLAGTGTNTDLLDAETSLAQANLLRVQALFSYELSRYALEQAVGANVWDMREE